MRFEKFNNKKKLVVGLLLLFIIGVVLVANSSLAKYKVTESINIAKGTINYKIADLNVIAMYQKDENGDYVSIDTMPTSGYIIDENESYCTLNGEEDTSALLYTNSNGDHVISNLSKGDKCYLYFNISSGNGILNNIDNISTRSSFSSIVTASSTGAIYTAEDNDGTSYYFAGASTDNYVKFANKYWRIIRINGDGTIRLIYDGTSARTNGTSSADTQISTSAFNSTYTMNQYVGYMYQNYSSTYGYVNHGYATSSTIKGVLDSWYTSNLSSYASYIDSNAGFCGDRNTHSGSGTSTEATNYMSYFRLSFRKLPELKCKHNDDLYTVKGSNKGNKALTYPIGLITADEVAMAGGLYGSSSSYYNSSFYLYTGNAYWTMTPFNFASSSANVIIVNGNGSIYEFSAYGELGVRPVINLRADVTLTGSGTSTDPYVVGT